jgi:hypothetical protein
MGSKKPCTYHLQPSSHIQQIFGDITFLGSSMLEQRL